MDPASVHNLVNTLILFSKLVLACNHPFHITSSLRTKAENKAVGGAEQSLHLTGKALDIRIRDLTKDQKLCLIKEGSRIFSRVIVYETHVHVDTYKNFLDE